MADRGRNQKTKTEKNIFSLNFADHKDPPSLIVSDLKLTQAKQGRKRKGANLSNISSNTGKNVTGLCGSIIKNKMTYRQNLFFQKEGGWSEGM